MTAFVYMLRCGDGKYYVGSTRASLDQRIAEHAAGKFDGYTARRLPVELVWYEAFEKISDAIAVERRLKGWSRVKKEALIRDDLDALPDLSKRGARRIDRP